MQFIPWAALFPSAPAWPLHLLYCILLPISAVSAYIPDVN